MAKDILGDQAAFDPSLLIGGMIEALHGLLIVVDRNYRVHLSNWHGRGAEPESSSEEFPLCYQMLHGRASPCRPCYVEESFRTSRPMQVELQNPRTGRIEDLQVSPIKDRQGRVTVVVEHIVDVTERRRAECALQKTSDINGALSRLGEELLRGCSRSEISRAVLSCARKTTESPNGFVGMVQAGKADLPQMTACSWDKAQERCLSVAPELTDAMKMLWSRLRRHRKPMLSNDSCRDARLAGLDIKAVGLERMLCMPAVIEDKLLGLVAVANADRRYDRHDLEGIKRVVAMFAMAIRHLQDDEEVMAHQRRLRDLATQLSLAEEQKGRAIAEDLHDSVGQYLSMASQRLKMLRVDRPPPAATLDQSIDLIDRAINQTRLLTVQLNPPVLYLLGLEAAVEWLAENSQESLGLEIAVHDDGREKPLSESVGAFVFRAIIELLRNVVKHSETQRAEVSLARRGDRLAVTVKDQGRGFDTNAGLTFDGSSFGLFSIEQRIISLGGSFQIHSSPGMGTRAVMLVPLNGAKAGIG